jgi:hypothetical protein
LDRRGFLNISLAGLNGVVWWAGLSAPPRSSSPHISSDLDQIRREYGTIDQPAYRIIESLRLADFSSFRQLFKSLPRHRPIEEVIEAQGKFTELTERLSALASSVTLVKTEPEKLRVIEEVFRISDEERALSAQFQDILCRANPELRANLKSIRLACETDESVLNQRRGSDECRAQAIEAISRRIIKDLTGRDLPDSVSFKFSELDDERISGASFFLTGEIIARPSSKAHLILTCCHEAGHLIAQHQEEWYFCGENSMSRESAVQREEACAYAFQFCAAAYLAANNPELAPDVERISRITHYNLLYEAYLGRQLMPIHSNGMAIFDAAWEVLGDPAKAFNFLARREDLTKEMFEVIASNSKLISSSILAEPYMSKRDMLVKNVSSLRRNVERLRSRLEMP